MSSTEPGERRTNAAGRAARQLERAPGERYARQEDAADSRASAARSTATAPLVKALLAAVAGAALLYVLGALLSSTGGLVVVAGLTGAAVGLFLARAAKQGAGDVPTMTRRAATWLALGISLAAVAIGAVATWLHALGEGGALGLIDYLAETFGLLVPAQLVVAGIAAAWGAGAGPVER